MSNQQKASRNSEVGDRNALPIKVKLFDAKQFQAKWEFLLYLCEIKSAQRRRRNGKSTLGQENRKMYEDWSCADGTRGEATGAKRSEQCQPARETKIFIDF